MQIVIDIREDFLYEIKHKHPNMRTELEQSVLDGTVLPKGHGRLIDAGELLKQQNGGEWNGIGFSQEYVYSKTIKNADTIIKADKES